MDHPVFISYSREDQAYARELAEYLPQQGLEVWLDDRLNSGDRWWQTIVQNIQTCAAFILVMTPEAEKSPWVEREVLIAQREEKKIFPLLLRGPGHTIVIGMQYLDVQDGRMPPQRFCDQLRSTATTTSAHRAEKRIPDEVTYSIIDEFTYLDFKRSLNVRLNQKVAEDVLLTIAMKLKNSDTRSYERTFIVYYLPNMKVDVGGWAITHFTPDLEVKIIGLTAEQEQELKTEAYDPMRDVIGTWLDEGVIGRKITFYHKGGELFMDTKYKDGSDATTELIEKAFPLGRKFEYKTDRGNGEYYLINNEGHLEEWDQDGHFLTARKFD